MNYIGFKVKRFAQKTVARVASFVGRQAQFSEIHDLLERGLLVIGRHTYGLPKVWMYMGSECKVVVGAFCSIAPGVQIIAGGGHPASRVSTFPFRIRWRMAGVYEDGMPETRGDIVIGSDVWLGTDAIVLSGVSIGHGAIVAAGSVVTHSVPPYAIVGGVPAAVIRYRFDNDTIQKLLQISWWEWDDSTIKEAVPLLSSSDVQAFLDSHGRPVR
jgi:acetyltransferase-like isoleucine patch superfamily enzyme